MLLESRMFRQFSLIAAASLLISFSANTIGDVSHARDIKNTSQPHETFAPAVITVFKVDQQLSKITWTGRKALGSHTGNIQVSDGKLFVENDKLRSGNVNIDIRTVTSTDIADKKNNDKLIGHLKSEDFFSTDKYPTASLIINSVVEKVQGSYEVSGTLTIKGISNPIQFPAIVTLADKQLRANAKIIVDRTKYNIRFGSKTFFDSLGDNVIYDDFEIDAAITATAE